MTIMAGLIHRRNKGGWYVLIFAEKRETILNNLKYLLETYIS